VTLNELWSKWLEINQFSASKITPLDDVSKQKCIIEREKEVEKCQMQTHNDLTLSLSIIIFN
jgi:hypothetical protein